MDYVYQYDLMGLGALFVTQLCLFFGKHNKLKSHKYLILIVFLCGSICTWDAVSGILINTKNPSFAVIAEIALVLYFLALICFPYTAMNFFLREMGEKTKMGIWHVIPVVLCLILTTVNHPLKLFFSLSKDMVYTRGPLSYSMIPLYVVYVFIVYLGVRKHRLYLGAVRTRSLTILVAASMAAAVIAYLRPHVSIVGGMASIGVAFACMIFYYVDDVRDELTGRLNLKGFERMTLEKLEKNKGEVLTLRIVEVYNINEIRERFGKKYADQIIINLMKHVSDKVRGTDCAYGRIASNRIAIIGPASLLPDVCGNFDLGDYIEDESPRFAYNFSIYGGDYPIREPGLPLSSMMDRAYFAMTSVSGSYHDYIGVFEGSLKHKYERRNEIEGKVKAALENKEFEVYMQPIVDTQTGQPVSAEALVRWREADGRMIPPGDFIPVFEQNGFVTELDLFVLDQVCRSIADWEKNGIEPVPVSVNISRKDLARASLVSDIVETVDKYGLDHSLVKIELTESAFIDDESVIKKTMDELHRYNFKLLMDDFGSGYSNLNMFDDLPVDIVKIDMRFLQNIEKSERGRIILGTVVDMTRKMGLETVVEGVETSYQYKYIHDLQCQMIQGFYFSKPIPVSEFTQMLKYRGEVMK